MKRDKLKAFLHKRIKLNLEWLLDKFENGCIVNCWGTPKAEYKRTSLQLRKDLIKYEKTFGYFLKEENENEIY